MFDINNKMLRISYIYELKLLTYRQPKVSG